MPVDPLVLAQALQQMAPTPRPDPTDFTGMMNTPLPPEQTAGYAKWLQSLPSDMDKSGRDYDLQGAYLAGLGTAGNGHLPDTFKKPNHMTFSDQSKYSGSDFGVGGKWTQTPDQSWAFAASPDQLRLTSPDAMARYFKGYEPGNTLVLPTGGK